MATTREDGNSVFRHMEARAMRLWAEEESMRAAQQIAMISSGDVIDHIPSEGKQTKDTDGHDTN
jgi:hypothetical protein